MIKNIAYIFHEFEREYFLLNSLQKFNEILTEIYKYVVTTVIFTLFMCIFCFQWRNGTVLHLILYCCNVNIWSTFMIRDFVSWKICTSYSGHICNSGTHGIFTMSVHLTGSFFFALFLASNGPLYRSLRTWAMKIFNGSWTDFTV